tara:strand:- start:253 stop:1350 length:1098 start_codon:yes stop_codon:yes gene_type:complete
MSLIKVKSRGTDNVAGRKNLIINGAMRVAQRGTSTTSVAASGYFATDRMKYYDSAQVVATVEQVSDAPSGSGFSFSHKVTATTADSSLGATELSCPLWYIVEKQDVDARLAYGTSSAKPITMSFWIKSNVTGTYTVSAYRSATPARVQAQTYTISSANTWEFKTLTFLGDTAEAIDVDLHFYFNGLVGGNYDNTSTTSGWATYSTGNWAGGHTATWGDTTNDTWQMTGLQLEVGSEASDFEHLSIGEELSLCKRYYEEISPANSTYYGVGSVSSGGSSPTVIGQVSWDLQKRDTPSVSYSGTPGSHFGVTRAGSSNAGMGTITFGNINLRNCYIQSTSSPSAMTTGYATVLNITGSGKIMISAEL